MFNAERLYYLLVQSVEPVPQDLSVLGQWLRKAGLEEGATVDLIFGEADILVRFWADSKKLHELLDEFNDARQHQFRILSLLLVNDMDITYQKDMEESLRGSPPWDWGSLKKYLDKLRAADDKTTCFPDNPCLVLPSRNRDTKNSKQLVRFWIFCEGYSGSQWQFFQQLRQFVREGKPPKHYGVGEPPPLDAASPAGKGREQLGGISLYTYEEMHNNVARSGYSFGQSSPSPASGTHSTISKGVIVKGEFEIPAQGAVSSNRSRLSRPQYQNLMENLSYFGHEMRGRLGIRTVTYLCARHLFHERAFRPTQFDAVGIRKKTILYSLLKTPLSFSYKYEFEKIPAYLSHERKEVLEAREDRIEDFITEMVSHCYEGMRHYHPCWWERLAHAREVFGWVASGNNDALRGTMTLRYPEMERRVPNLLEKLGRVTTWKEKQDLRLKKELKTLYKKYVPDEGEVGIAQHKVQKIFPPEPGLTYKGIEEVLHQVLKELTPYCKFPETPQMEAENLRREHLERLTKAVTDCREERNRLLHGEIYDVFSQTIERNGSKEAIWHTYAINYLKLYLALPLGEAVLEELINEGIFPGGEVYGD
jgi:hypothetical protein